MKTARSIPAEISEGLSANGLIQEMSGVIEFGPAEWSEYLRAEGLPPDFLRAADHAALHLLVARVDGTVVAAALAYDFDGDCGIFNVGTVEHARRRGLATALTAVQLYDALSRGCQTASLQATPMAERVYAAAGFRDLGRFLEYVPPTGLPRPPQSGRGTP